MGKYVTIALLLSTVAVSAMDEKIFIYPLPSPTLATKEELARVQPTEEQKIEALREAYKIRSGASDPRPVKTERIIPVAKPEDKNEIDEAADPIDKLQQKWVHLRGDRIFAEDKSNICTIHRMRKVTTLDGKSWKCRK